MRMAAKTRPWTRSDLDRLPDDGNRYEVLDGALLVTPAPNERHQRLATELAAQLVWYCKAHSLGTVYAYGAIPRGRSELQPDVMVVPGGVSRRSAGWKGLPRPLLVVEILSDSTRQRDLLLKRDAYERWGIPEYWIVDADERCVTVVHPGRDDLTVADVLRWRPSADVPALEIDVGTMLRR